jgi:hypothetical protein
MKLFTSWGNDLYLQVATQKKQENIVSFKQKALSEYRKYEKLLSDFLNDETMAKQYKMDNSDVDGWEIYHKLMDGYTVYKHFK